MQLTRFMSVSFPRVNCPDILFMCVFPQSANFLVGFTRSIYREVTHVRGYDFEGLIGNGGGYVGLFLGFAIWQFPDFCNLVYNIFITKIDQDILAN